MAGNGVVYKMAGQETPDSRLWVKSTIPELQDRSQPAWLRETPSARQEEMHLPPRIHSSRKAVNSAQTAVLPDCKESVAFCFQPSFFKAARGQNSYRSANDWPEVTLKPPEPGRLLPFAHGSAHILGKGCKSAPHLGPKDPEQMQPRKLGHSLPHPWGGL